VDAMRVSVTVLHAVPRVSVMKLMQDIISLMMAVLHRTVILKDVLHVTPRTTAQKHQRVIIWMDKEDLQPVHLATVRRAALPLNVMNVIADTTSRWMAVVLRSVIWMDVCPVMHQTTVQTAMMD